MPVNTAARIFSPQDQQLLDRLGVDEHNRSSIYNVPGYQPVFHETRHLPARVTGTWPAELQGVYLRNGANRRFRKTYSRIHPFNGAGMLHQVQIAGTEATYSNFFLRTPRDAVEEAAGREVYLNFNDVADGALAGLPKLGLIEAKKQQGVIPNLSPLELSTASTAVQSHGGKIYGLNETAYPFALNTREVEGKLVMDGTGVLETWNGKLQSPFSAHPRIDPETGEYFNLSLNRQDGSLCYARLESGALVDHLRVHQQDPTRAPMAFVHDCVVTQHHLVFPDTSLRGDRARIGRHDGMYYFDPEHRMRWGVLPRYPAAGDTVRWFDTDGPGFLWHMVNGWEQNDSAGRPQIVLYAPKFDAYPDGVLIHSPKEPHAQLHKWVLDLASGQVVENKRLLDGAYERPSINPARSGRESRYAYLLDESSGYMGKGILKYDLLHEAQVGYQSYGDALGGEPLFVPRDGAVDEDDGYLIDLLMKDDTAALVVFSAASLQEIARVHLPARVPFGVHACWLDQRQLAGLRHTC